MHLHLNKFYKECKCSEPSTTNNNCNKWFPNYFCAALLLEGGQRKPVKISYSISRSRKPYCILKDLYRVAEWIDEYTMDIIVDEVVFHG